MPRAYSMPQTLITASFALAILCLIIIVVFSQRKSIARGNAVLLVGPPDAGKTAILSTLVYKQTLSSHTSLQTNASVFTLPSARILRIVDVPGHPRIRDQFQEYLSEAKAVLFVVDTSTISRNGPATAEHLHHILHALTSLPPSQTLPALVILAHKTDLLKSTAALSATITDSLAISRVKTVLERELDKRRASQSGGVGVEGLGAEGERSEMGGLECHGPDGVFRFSEWEGGEVAFIGTSVKIEKEYGDDKENAVEDGLSILRQWLDDL